MMFTKLESYQDAKNTAKVFKIEVTTKQNTVIQSSGIPIELLEQALEDYWQAIESNGLYFIWNNYGTSSSKEKCLAMIHTDNIAHVLFKFI